MASTQKKTARPSKAMTGVGAKKTSAKRTAAGGAKPGTIGAAKVRARVAAKPPRASVPARTAKPAASTSSPVRLASPVSPPSVALVPEDPSKRGPAMTAEGRILITGATGFLGAHLVRLLATRTDPRRIRTLQTTVPGWLARLGVENLKGSVTSPEDVKRALEGVREVYHLAGMVSSKEEDTPKMYALHVDGTRVLCKAAIEAGVRRVVMASTSGTIAVSKHADASLDESCGTPLEIISRWPYYASKAYQEETAKRVLGDKVELVTVNPSLLLGPGDERLSSSRVVLQFLGREILLTPPGGLSFVDVRDVAAALPVAMEKGRPGERYLLGAANWSFSELFGRLARMTKVPAPVLKVPGRAPVWIAQAQASLYRRWGKTPPFEPASVDMASYYWYFDGRKAADELGFEPRDPTDTLFDTVTYLREHFLDGFKGAVSAIEHGSAPAPVSAQDAADEAAFESTLPS